MTAAEKRVKRQKAQGRPVTAAQLAIEIEQKLTMRIAGLERRVTSLEQGQHRVTRRVSPTDTLIGGEW